MDHLKPAFLISTMRTMELRRSVCCVLVATVCAGSYQQIYTFCNPLGSSVIDNVLTNDNKFDCISFLRLQDLMSGHFMHQSLLNYVCKITRCLNKI